MYELFVNSQDVATAGDSFVWYNPHYTANIRLAAIGHKDQDECDQVKSILTFVYTSIKSFSSCRLQRSKYFISQYAKHNI